MLNAIGRRTNEGGGSTRPRVLTMFETSSSSSSLLSNGSSRSSQTDDLSRTVDGYAEEAEQHLEQALKNQEDVATDIKVLMQLLRQVTCVASRIYIYGYGLI